MFKIGDRAHSRPRAAGRFARRTAVTVTAALALMFAAPTGSIPAGGGFPVSWLWSWLRQPTAYAVTAWEGLPVQRRGPRGGSGHYVDSEATRAAGGAGHAPTPTPHGLPAASTPSLARKPSTAPAASEHSFDTKTSKRVAGLSSATTDMYQNKDGSYTRKVFGRPVNYRNSAGVWTPIDSTLVKRSDGRLHVAANSFQISVAGSVGASTAPPVQTPAAGGAAASDVAPPLVSMTLPSGQTIAYTLDGAADVAPTLADGGATYTGILPDTNLELAPFDSGINETLVLDSPSAPSSWLFPLRLSGLTPKVAADGSIDLLDASGKAVAFFPHGHMSDSNVDPRSGAPAGSSNVTFELVSYDGGTALRVTADPAWLHDPARVYPVEVDPTTTTGTTGDVYVDNDSSTTSSDQNGNDLAVGTWDSGTVKSRSFIHLDNFDGALDGKRITAATLRLYLTWAYSCTTLRAFNVDKVTQSWTVANLETSSYPGPSISSAIGHVTVDPGPACTNTAANRSVGEWVQVALTPQTFNDWSAGGSAANNGLALTASETDSYGWKRFTSANYESGAYKPELDLTYTNNVAPQVDYMFPEYGYATPTLRPELLVSGHDPDGFPNKMTYDFQVFNSDSTKIADSGYITAKSWVVPSGVLTWGQDYTWTVIPKDGLITGSSVKYALSTPVTQPPITGNLAQNGGEGFNPDGGDYTATATDARVSSVGPALAIERDYNSEDPRVAEAFGAGWSSIVDTKATENTDSTGTIQTVTVTYPAGNDVSFGRDADGTFVPPQGRFATFTSVTGGYHLIDKDGTTYSFTTSLGSGEYGLTSIADAQGRTETFAYASGHITTITGAAGRALHLTWDTPSGATVPHVSAVTTDPATSGDSGTALTWTYGYSADLLTSVCSPDSATECTTYTYGSGSQYYDAVMNAGPSSYWRIGDSSGTVATSAVLGHEGTDNGTYSGVTLGQAGPLPGATATAGTFNGTSSAVHLPGNLVADASYQTISMWFKAASGAQGVLLSYQADPVTKSSTAGNYVPAIYIGTSGRLFGQFWDNSLSPMYTSGSVADGQWHQVVLSGAGDSQAMYVDGVLVGSKSSTIVLYATNSTANEYIGSGFIGGGWPDEPHQGQSGDTGYPESFHGGIAEVASFERSLTGSDVAALYRAGHVASAPLTQITTPSGDVSASVTYDRATNTVTQVTDGNGGVWKLNPATVSGSSQVYAGAVLSAGPVDYWRMSESGVVDAINQVNGDTATYDGVGLGTDAGPFSDSKAAKFTIAGTTAMTMPDVPVDTAGSFSISAWVKLTTASGNQRAVSLNGTQVPGFWLGYNGSNNQWQATMYQSDTPSPPSNRIGVAATANTWTHLAGTYDASTRTLRLYVNGQLAGSTTVAGTAWTATGQLAVGRGFWNGNPTDYWAGDIAEVAVFGTKLSDAQVAAEYAARGASSGVPVRTVTTTDPTNKTITHKYDVATGREIATTDALGNTTQYGYDTDGFLRTVTDPNGDVTTTTHDVRGNTISSETCQDQSEDKCSTVFYTYYPDDTSKTLTPDPRDDVMLTMRDGRSSSSTDDTYLTTYGYDAHGNRVSVTDPLGRVTTTDYTDGTTVAAADGGFAPAGLPMTIHTPGGAVQQVVYFQDGDIATVTDPDGKVTTYTYDGLGRTLSKTDTTDSFPDGVTTSYTYNGRGDVLTQTDPPITDRVTGAVHTAVQTNVYDADDHVTSQTVADTTGGDASRSQSWTYNSHGEQDSITDPDASVTHLTYDAYGNVVTEIDPDGTELDTTYDANGNLLTTVQAGYTGDPNNPSSPTNLVTDSRAYDPAGRVATDTDAMGWVTSYTYTDNGLVATVTRTDGSHTYVQEEDSYDAAGNLVTRIAANGTAKTTMVVDAAGRTTSQTVDPDGLDRSTTMTYSPDDYVLNRTLSDPDGTVSSTDYTYDALGNPLSQTVHNGTSSAVTTWAVDENGRTVSETDPDGNVTDYTYDEDGEVTVVTNPAVDVEVDGGSPVLTRPISYYGYDTFGEQVETKDPNGNVSVTGYGAGGRVTSTQLPSYTPPGSSTPITPVSTRTYDALGQLSTVIDPLGHTTSYTYDQLGDVAKTVDPNNGASTFTYDTVGDQLSATDPTGAMTTATYDYLGRQLTSTQVVRQAGTNYTGTFDYGDDSYGSAGQLTETTTADGVHAYQTYDAAGEVVTSTDGSGHVTHYGYDGAGRVIKTTLPDGTYTTMTFDEAGNATATSSYDAGGTLLSTQGATYDPAGHELTATDARGTTLTYTYDATGVPTSEVQPINGSDSITTSFGYDADGNQTRFTDGRGNAFLTTYNPWSLPESQIEPATPSQPDPGDGTFTSIYDADGHLVTQVQPGGVSVTNTYDALGNVTREQGDGAEVTTVDRTFGYDADGRVTTAGGSAGSDSLTYDDRGLLTSVTGASGSSSFGYDADGDMTSRTDAAGSTSYGYDSAGRLSTVTNPTAGLSLTDAYNVDSQLASITYGTGGNVRSLAYDAQHRLTSDVLKTASGASVASISYGYDADGNETSKTTAGFSGSATNTYTYDLANRLTSWDNGTSTTAYAYDKSGNRVQAGANLFTYDARNQVQTENGSTHFAYTLRGTLASVDDGTVMATQTDAFGQVISQDSTSGTQSYDYDAFGRLIRPGFSYTGTGNTLAADGTATYTRDPGDGLVGVGSGGSSTVAWTDQHTDVVGEFASTGTALSGSTTYDPLGTVVSTAGMTGQLGYQSEWTDSYTGRVNMASRWYDPATGQFDNRDATSLSALPDSVNADRFAYADDNPLIGTDPTGRCWTCFVSSAWHATTSAVSSAWHTMSSAASSAWDTVASGASSAWHGTTSFFSSAYHKAASLVKSAGKKIKSAASSLRKKVGKAISTAKTRVKQAINKAKQVGKAVVAKTTKAVRTAEQKVHDAYDASAQWVKDHKDTLIEVGAMVGGIIAGLACTAATAGAGAVACMVGASALINVAKDAAEGKIHGVGDLLKSAGSGALQGLAGAAGGAVGGKLASALVGRLGSQITGRLAGRALTGAITGGAADTITQVLTTGHVNPLEVAESAGIGAIFGARAKSACAHSFDPNTKVLMADGEKRPIKDVNVGDAVASTDPQTGKDSSQTVVALHINHDSDMADVTVRIGGKVRVGALAVAGLSAVTSSTAVLHTTQTHPLWDQTRHEWVDAGQFRVGDRLRTDNGATVTVTAVHDYTAAKYMRDLTLNDIHTYYVIAGTTPVLVHNCGGSVDGHRSICDCANGGNPIQKRGPKPFGEGPHNQTIADVAGKVDDGTVIAGGQVSGLPETTFPTPGGYKSSRRPDILVQRDDGSIYGINVGKQAASGAPIKREAQALWDLEGIGLEMHFVAYN